THGPVTVFLGAFDDAPAQHSALPGPAPREAGRTVRAARGARYGNVSGGRTGRCRKHGSVLRHLEPTARIELPSFQEHHSRRTFGTVLDALCRFATVSARDASSR